jgi:hypothetical protein
MADTVGIVAAAGAVDVAGAVVIRPGITVVKATATAMQVADSAEEL